MDNEHFRKVLHQSDRKKGAKRRQSEAMDEATITEPSQDLLDMLAILGSACHGTQHIEQITLVFNGATDTLGIGLKVDDVDGR